MPFIRTDWDGLPPVEARQRTAFHWLRVPDGGEPCQWLWDKMYQGWWLISDMNLAKPADMAGDFVYEGEVPSMADVRAMRAALGLHPHAVTPGKVDEIS